jgi:hypothetical protein
VHFLVGRCGVNDKELFLFLVNFGFGRSPNEEINANYIYVSPHDTAKLPNISSSG